MIDNRWYSVPRLAAVAMLGLFIVVVWIVVMAPFVHFFQTKADERESDLKALSRNQALIMQAPQIRAALNRIETSPRWGRLYDGQKTDIALVQMESDLREILKAPNNPISMTARPSTPKGALTSLAVKVTLTMSMDQLTETLERLQGHSKFLSIDNLTIQAADNQAIDSNPVLFIQAEITGFMVASTGART